MSPESQEYFQRQEKPKFTTLPAGVTLRFAPPSHDGAGFVAMIDEPTRARVVEARRDSSGYSQRVVIEREGKTTTGWTTKRGKNFI